MNLKPLSDLIIVRPDAAVTHFGIIELAKSSQEEAKSGVVLATGPGKMRDTGKFEPMMVRVGQRVLYSEYAKEKFTLAGETLFTMHDDDVLGVLDE